MTTYLLKEIDELPTPPYSFFLDKVFIPSYEIFFYFASVCLQVVGMVTRKDLARYKVEFEGGRVERTTLQITEQVD